MYWFVNLINPYFIYNRTQETYKMFNLKWTILIQNNVLMAATQLKKVGTGPYLLLCSILSLLTTVCKHMGTKESSCWTFGREMFRSWLIWDSSCSTVLGLFIFHFVMHPLFSTGERSGLQAGRFSTRTLLLWSHAHVIDAVCSLVLSC